MGHEHVRAREQKETKGTKLRRCTFLDCSTSKPRQRQEAVAHEKGTAKQKSCWYPRKQMKRSTEETAAHRKRGKPNGILRTAFAIQKGTLRFPQTASCSWGGKAENPYPSSEKEKKRKVALQPALVETDHNYALYPTPLCRASHPAPKQGPYCSQFSNNRRAVKPQSSRCRHLYSCQVSFVAGFGSL
jgi:hypothetical protein